MKKIALFLVATVMVSFVACGQKAATQEVAVDVIETVEVTVDSLGVVTDSLLQVVEEVVAE